MKGILASELRQYIIRPTLQNLDLWSPAAENLLLGTAAQESQLGYYLVQRNGPALGIYQIEPATHRDVWTHYLSYRLPLADRVSKLTVSSPKLTVPDTMLITNLAYTTAIARIIYQRAAQPLPPADDIEQLANYWKQHFNTPLGKGTVIEFIQNYKEYIQ